MKKIDEVALMWFVLYRQSAPLGTVKSIVSYAQSIGMAPKRLEYLLNKWAGKGYWEYGINPFGGWLTSLGETTFKQDYIDNKVKY